MIRAPRNPALRHAAVKQGAVATAVSLLLGIGAHASAGGFAGHGPGTAHLLVLLSLAIVVGLIHARANSPAPKGPSRHFRSEWLGTAVALVVGQIGAHTALAALGHSSGLVPDAGMTAWHAVALPVGVAVLVLSQRLDLAYRRQLRAISGSVTEGNDCGRWAARCVASAHPNFPTRYLTSPCALRGPPSLV